VVDVEVLSSDDMRASDQERELTMAILCEAYAAGRLDLGEVRERAAAACRSRTWGDLRRLTMDIPDPQAFQPSLSAVSAPPGTGTRHWLQRSGTPILLVMVGTLAMAAATCMPMVGAPLAAVGLIMLSVSVLFAAGIAVTFALSAAETAEYHPGQGKLYRDTI
jgi:hypothetical protein